MSVNDTGPPSQETTKRHSKVDELPSDNEKLPPITTDTEQQPTADSEDSRHAPKESAFKSLGLLDRFLAVWIFLAMAVGIILGNFVHDVGPALQKGTFVGVSIPIGAYSQTIPVSHKAKLTPPSRWPARHDVPHPLQSPIRNPPPRLPRTRNLDPNPLQHHPELDHRASRHGTSTPPRFSHTPTNPHLSSSPSPGLSSPTSPTFAKDSSSSA